ncbi:MAG: UDP-N-acetylmuramate:L-alanyl-gamma-D-glutamyl-meso-diaminopimelate ligase [Pseudomonadota bacterium]
MHIHILGICGTFMGGIAALAQQAGHRVTGCDQNVYPPMSTQLESLGIELIEGWGTEQLGLKPDLFVIGNVVSRGNPLMEAILKARLPFSSGPQWLGEHVLAGRRPIAVAGTHGKTTTTAIIAWTLQHAGLAPGFLVGGVVPQLSVSAALGDGPCFVVEADEYDTAFFDKRAKFVHYRPDVAIVNNIEFDHADIYSSLEDIQWQFHQLMRIVPGDGLVVHNHHDDNVANVLSQGCWSPRRSVSAVAGSGADVIATIQDDGALQIQSGGALVTTHWNMRGSFNAANAAAATAACLHAGLTLEQVAKGLASFEGVKRRLEPLTEVNGATVYDDFAHHPTAIRATLATVARETVGNVIAVFEPRSNTMRAGVHKDTLAAAFQDADQTIVLSTTPLDWDVVDAFESATGEMRLCDNAARAADHLKAIAKAGDTVVLLSNGALDGLRERLLREEAA